MPAGEIMRRFYAKTLKSSNGAPVTKLSQAKAIAASYSGEGEKKRKHPKPSYPKGKQS